MSGARRTGQLLGLVVMTAVAVAATFLAPAGATPVPLPAPVTERIDAGNRHTCVVDDDHGVRCWGRNDFGQLGHGQNGMVSWRVIGDDETPRTAGPVDLGGAGALKVAAGALHSCAVLVDHAVSCWGYNLYGVLGTGGQGVNNPGIGDFEVPGGIRVALGARTAKAIAAGGNHTCVITDQDKVMCWGISPDGELGYPDAEEIVGDDEGPDSAGAVRLGRQRTAQAISAGDEHTCAVTDDGALYCWGSNEHGQLGRTDLTLKIGDDETPEDAGPVDLGGARAVDVTAGRAHTCAELESGELRCWGDNTYGATGLGTSGGNLPPVSGAVALDVPTVTTAVAGTDHTCATLAGTVHDVQCWGRVGEQSKDGRLGLPVLGTFEDVGDDEVPASVPLVHLRGASVVALAAGKEHTCAVTSAGEIRCWGLNAYGAVGHGQGASRDIGDDETPGSVNPVNLGATITCCLPPTPEPPPFP